MVNPGGPGASAVDTVACMGAALADTDIRRRFDLVGFDPRGVGHSTPELRCRTDAEFDAYRREPMADYSPAGVAHIEAALPRVRRSAASSAWARNSWPTSVPRRRPATSTWCAPRSAKSRSTISASPTERELGAAYAERYRRSGAGHGARRRRRPEPGPDRREHPPNGGHSKRLSTAYAADCAQSAGCPLGTDPAQFVNRYHQLVDPLVQRARRDLRSARTELPGRDHRHRQRALHASAIGVPDQRAARAAARHRRRVTCCCSPTTTSTATRTGTTGTCRTPSPRSAASTRSTRPTRRCGPTPTGRSARRRRS